MNEQAILRRTHRLAQSRHELQDEYARKYPVTDTTVVSLFADADEVATFEVVDDPPHVVARHDDWDYEVTGWNRTYAIGALVEAYLIEHHPKEHVTYGSDDVDQHEFVNRKFGQYRRPTWEAQVIGLKDGGYTEPFTLTHLEQVSASIPVEWYGLTADEELVYIRYRGGALRIYIGGPDHDERDLAYYKQVQRFPDSSLTEDELLDNHWPEWATYVKSPRNPLPEEWHERLSDYYIDEVLDDGAALIDAENDAEDDKGGEGDEG